MISAQENFSQFSILSFFFNRNCILCNPQRTVKNSVRPNKVNFQSILKVSSMYFEEVSINMQ